MNLVYADEHGNVFDHPEYYGLGRSGDMVVEMLEQLLKLVKDLKPTDRSEKARRYAILFTELEKLHAYAKEYEL